MRGPYWEGCLEGRDNYDQGLRAIMLSSFLLSDVLHGGSS